MPVHDISRAMSLAHYAHFGQVDGAGLPLLAHVMRVAASVAHLGDLAVVVGLLHDSVEDCEPLSVDQVRAMFGDEVADAVDALTHRKNEPYTDYLGRIVAAGGVALAVKRADNMDNRDERRLAGLQEDVAARLRKKYAAAAAILF